MQQLDATGLRSDGKAPLGAADASAIDAPGESGPIAAAVLSDLLPPRYRDIFEALPAAVYTTDAEGRITSFNSASVDLAGRTPEIGREKWCVSWKLYTEDGAPLPLDKCPMAVALRERRPVRNISIVAERPDGARVPVMPFPTPLYDAQGRFAGAVNMLVDISELKSAQVSAARRADSQAVLFRFTDRLFRAETLAEVEEAALDAITSALGCQRASILLCDEGGVMRFAAWRGLSEGYRAAVDGHSPWDCDAWYPEPIAIDDVAAADLDAHLKGVVVGEGIAALAFIPLLAHGRLVGKFMAYWDAPRSMSQDEMNLALNIARQLGFAVERSKADEARASHEKQRTLLLHELNHRVKNTLATVQSLAGQTLRSTEKSADARALLDSRLIALSRAHDVLTRENWNGASLREVAGEALEPFSAEAGRISISGPDARLDPRQALAIAMALHELATNAAKYGALSGEQGQVDVAWRISPAKEGRALTLEWRESGGPQVTAPGRAGFGSRLIERLVQDLGAAAEIDYLAAGVRATIRATLDA